jgi:hypothetical protein
MYCTGHCIIQCFKSTFSVPVPFLSFLANHEKNFRTLGHDYIKQRHFELFFKSGRFYSIGRIQIQFFQRSDPVKMNRIRQHWYYNKTRFNLPRLITCTMFRTFLIGIRLIFERVNSDKQPMFFESSPLVTRCYFVTCKSPVTSGGRE